MSSIQELAELYITTKEETDRQQVAAVKNPLTTEEATNFINMIATEGEFVLPAKQDKKYREFAKWFNNQPTEERDGLIIYVSKTKGMFDVWSNFVINRKTQA